MLKTPNTWTDPGFTLIEVLAGIVIVTTFTLVSLQTMVIGAVFRARAQSFTEATAWIQEDLETVRFQASTAVSYSGTANTPDSRCNATSLETGFANALRNATNSPGTTNIQTSAPFRKFSNYSRTSNRSGRTYTITRTLTPSDTAPHNVLQISYDVVPEGGGISVARLYTEVIPDAVFRCP